MASAYQAKFMDLALYDDTYDLFCEAITHDQARIVDVGCGPGNITRYLLSKDPTFQVLGIDVAPNMIQLAQSNNPTASFKVMDGRRLAELDSTYHGIICGFCLPYLSPADAAKLLADASNLLLEDGVLYLSFVEGDPSKSGFQVGSSGDRVYFYYHALADLKTLLGKNQFSVLHIVRKDYLKTKSSKEIHTIVIAKKTAA
ncbi:trans-aconitate 2-methyltransferase [Rufibacter glacialis]|uniref:trans-aconitate 2-methyltransferase n=1 Tax=Rufibacter glacialis TaxID=1259555 RepID=UPI003558356D